MTPFTKRTLLTACVAAWLGGLLTPAQAGQKVKLLANNVNLRGTPSLQGREITTMKVGQTVEVLDEQNGWYKVAINGKTGWAYGPLVGACDTEGRRLSLEGQQWVGLPVLSVEEPLLSAPQSGARQVATLATGALYVIKAEDARKVDGNPLGYSQVKLINGTTGYVRNIMVDSWLCQ